MAPGNDTAGRSHRARCAGDQVSSARQPPACALPVSPAQPAVSRAAATDTATVSGIDDRRAPSVLDMVSLGRSGRDAKNPATWGAVLAGRSGRPGTERGYVADL